MANYEDLCGNRYGRLTAISYAGGIPRSKWNCVCDCGNEVEVFASNLKRGSTQSCGCLQKELLSKRKKTHGGDANKEPLYNVWCSIRKRCLSPNNPNYRYYGERGISICNEWTNYQCFRDWALSSGYSEGLSIDRIDVNGNYEPKNCRWTDSKTQQNNRRSCRYLTMNGETHTAKEWSEILDINYQTLYANLKRHDFDLSLTINHIRI